MVCQGCSSDNTTPHYVGGRVLEDGCFLMTQGLYVVCQDCGRAWSEGVRLVAVGEEEWEG